MPRPLTTARQVLLLATLLLATLAGLTGAALAVVPTLLAPGIFIQAASLLLFAFAFALAYRIDSLPMLRGRARDAGPPHGARDRHALKAASVLLHLLAILAVALLLIEALAVAGVAATPRAAIVHRLSSVLQASIAPTLGLAIFLSLRVRYGLTRSGMRTLFHALSLGGLLILAVGTIALRLARDSGTLGNLEDAPILMLVGSLFAILAGFTSRSLPTLYSVFAEDPSPYQPQGYVSRTKSVVVPTLIAFALLFVVLLLFLLLGAGAIGRVRDVLLQPAFLSLVVLTVLAMVGSMGAALFLLRRAAGNEDGVEVFQEKADKRTTTANTLLYSSLALAALVGLVSLLLWRGVDIFGLSRMRWIDLFAIALLIGLGPYGFYAAHQHTRIRRLEDRFPDFLRDIASSHRGGLTLHSAVAIAARGEYGPLTPEVKRMADQMTWNVSFDEALERFADRVATPLVRRAVSLIQEAGRSGGSTSDVLLAAARDARQLKNMENERRLSMVLYSVIIYITFFVFLLVAAVLYNQFVPQIIASAEALQQAGPGAGGFVIQAVPLESYRAFYFMSAIVQGAGGGIVAGMMASGKAVLGLRHAFIMVFISYVTFALFLA